MNEQLNTLGAQPAVMRATVTIKRKATGLVETYEVIGTPTPEFRAMLEEQHPQEQPKED